MGLKLARVDEAKRELHIVMDLDTPRPSKSGKTMVIATTKGNTTSEAKFNGSLVTIGVNAYIKPSDHAASKKSKKKKEDTEDDE